MRRFLFVLLALALATGLFIPMAAPAAAAETDTIYGITTSGEIHVIDPLSGAHTYLDSVENCPTFTSVGSSSVSGPNGLAYCELTNRIYYTEYYADADNVNVNDGKTSLYFIDLDDGNEVFAGYLDGEIACADIYNGLYYYIAGGPQLGYTDNLYEVAFDANGLIDTITLYADISGGANHNWGFWGDIAVWDGVIYAFGDCKLAGDDYEFFTVNCDGTGFDIIAETNYNLQLAFGLDGTLYGHSFQTKDNYVVTWDADAGTVTSTWQSQGSYSYTDLASGSTSTEPNTYDICGFKFAEWEGERIPLPNWEIILEEWVDGEFWDWITVDNTTTDENGRYCFTDLPAGKYRVRETLKEGWDQVYPEGNHIVTVPVESVVYGTQRTTGKILEINPTTGDATEVFTAPVPPVRSYSPGSPNGLAYDSENNRLYYTEYTGGNDATAELYFYDGVGQIYAGELTGAIACADFYGDKYYYIAGNPTDDLYEVTFNSDGTVATNTKLADISGNAHRWTFGGDIAISPDGVIYGVGHCGASGHGFEFFKVNRDGTGFEMIDPSVHSFSLQLAFGSDGVLYGHASTGDGLFYEVDLTTGDLSPAFPNSTEHLYTDLASGQSLYNFVNTPTLYCFDETAWAAQENPGETRFMDPPGNWATWIDYDVGRGPAVFPLYAGQTYHAGDLLVWDNSTTLFVKYVASGEAGGYAPEGYCEGTWTGLTEYHLQVVDSLDDFEAYRVYNQKKDEYGAPIPGSFDNLWEGEKDDATDWIEVDIAGFADDEIFIAAHAVMWWCGYDCDALNEIYLA